MLTTKIIELEMSAQPKRGFTEVKQNDADGVQLKLILRNSDYTAYLIPDGAVVSFLAVKSDKKSVVLSSTDDNPRVTYTANSNIVLVTLPAQVLAVAGIILCNVTISKSGATTSTQTFTLSCAEALTANDLTSSSEFQSLSKMLADLTARKAEFDAINDKIANMALGYGGTFATLAALQADANANTPDGKKRFYIVAANGHHYYWSNITSAWTDGGAIIPYADVVALKNDVIKIFGDIGIGIEYGCEVLPSSPLTNNTVYVTAGVARLPNGQTVTISGQTVTIYGYGYGIIFINSSGAIGTLAGDDANDPVPATPDGALLLASVYLYDGTNMLDESRITDMRKFTYGLRSYVKNTTYESIGARINAIEEDVETLEARVTQAETDIDSLQTSIAGHDTELDALKVYAAKLESELAALRTAQAQMSGDTRINLNGTGKITAVPKNAAVLGVGGTIKGMTLTPLVAQSNVPIGSSVTFNSVSGNKYYDGLHKTILTGTGSEMAVTNDTSAAANIYVIDLNAHGLQTKTAGEMMQICPNYISGTQSVMPMRIRTTDESNNTKSVCYIDPKPLRRVPNGVCDTVDLATGKRTINIKEYTIKSSDITAIDTTYTNIDVLSLSKPADFIYYNVAGWDKSKMQALYIEGFAAGVGVSDDISLVYTMFNRNITNIGLIVPKGAYSDIAAARAAFAGKKIWYQLATPVIEHNVVTGSLLSYPKGLIICEPAIADAGVYDDGITILRTDYPIQSLETLCKINPDGTQTPLDVSAATITDAGTKITHPALFNGDIVAFTYFTASSGIIGENVFNYVNANGLTLGADGKYYRVGFAIDINGNISLTKTEVV